MRRMRAFGAALFATVAVAAATTPAPAAQERPLPDADAFLREVRRHLQRDEDRRSGYTYVETRRESKLDRAGRATSQTVKVIESYPGFPGEERWERVISENGRPVPSAELERKDRERAKKAMEYARRVELEPDKVKAEEARVREKNRRENAEVVDEIFRVYDFRMLRREPIEEHDTIVFALTPRADSKPRTRDGTIMKHFVAQAWVSETEYELVRVEVEAIDTVSIGLGLIARVHEGTRAAFTRRKVNGEAWLPATASYTASVRIAVFKRLRERGSSEFSNYRKFSVGTSTTYTTQRQEERDRR